VEISLRRRPWESTLVTEEIGARRASRAGSSPIRRATSWPGPKKSIM
jgi:hypothetical protein